jgi:hypothetical protein
VDRVEWTRVSWTDLTLSETVVDEASVKVPAPSGSCESIGKSAIKRLPGLGLSE